MYLAKKDVPTGIAITDDEYWMLSATRGNDGDVTTAAMNSAIEYAVGQSETRLQTQINAANSGIGGYTNRIVALETQTIPLNRGGTGATTAAQARTNLGITIANIGAAPTSHTHAQSDVTGVTPINKGGTNATTAEQAVANLGYASHMVIFSETQPAVVNGKIWLKPI